MLHYKNSDVSEENKQNTGITQKKKTENVATSAIQLKKVELQKKTLMF